MNDDDRTAEPRGTSCREARDLEPEPELEPQLAAAESAHPPSSVRVAVLTGGATPERCVALSGAGQVCRALRATGFEVIAADTCSGVLDTGSEERLLSPAVGKEPPSASELRELEQREDVRAVLAELVEQKVDVVFPILHGRDGEGGLLQAALELFDLRFTGSMAAGAYVAMDKVLSKRLFEQLGVPTAEWRTWPLSEQEAADLTFPLVVKPSRVGSTVGLSLVEHGADLDEAVRKALQFDDEVLLERFLPGRELTVGVLGERALAVGEIVVAGKVFDYESKYTAGAAEEIFPAKIPQALALELQELAVRVHQGLRLRHYSRVDFRLDAENRGGGPVCLEVNTLPGMTSTSLLPQSAAAVGISFEELCRRIVLFAMS